MVGGLSFLLYYLKCAVFQKQNYLENRNRVSVRLVNFQILNISTNNALGRSRIQRTSPNIWQSIINWCTRNCLEPLGYFSTRRFELNAQNCSTIVFRGKSNWLTLQIWDNFYFLGRKGRRMYSPGNTQFIVYTLKNLQRVYITSK